MNFDADNLLTYKGYLGTVDYALAGNLFFGKVVGIDGLISYEGADIDRLTKDFNDAIDDYLDMCEEEGITPQKPYGNTLDINISQKLYKDLAAFAAKKNKSIHQAVEEAIMHYILI
jgi:predicted HicB family RNase H-like nuclease